jgi:hypothetical protein
MLLPLPSSHSAVQRVSENEGLLTVIRAHRQRLHRLGSLSFLCSDNFLLKIWSHEFLNLQML